MMIMASAERDTTFTIAVVVVILLVFTGGLLLLKLLRLPLVDPKPETAKPAPTQTQVVAKRDLEAYVQLKPDDLELRKGNDPSAEAAQKAPTIEEFSKRYLMAPIISGEEVKREMVAPSEATSLLDNAVAVSLPATPGSTLGGQLRVGELVDVVAVHNSSSPADSDPIKSSSFEKLLVLNIETKQADEKTPKEPVSITLALPANRRDEFAAAVANATVTVTRKIPAKH